MIPNENEGKSQNTQKILTKVKSRRLETVRVWIVQPTLPTLYKKSSQLNSTEILQLK